jgi:hypothetical protein
VLSPLGLSQIAIGELFALQKHLDDPQEFVSDVDMRLLQFKFVFRAYLAKQAL